MNKFRLGIITGMSSLIVAVPMVVQISGAQSASSDTAAAVPSQSCVEAMAHIENVRLAQFDAMNAKRKQSMQERVDALESIAQIADDTAREDALRQMREDRKKQMETEKGSAVSAEIQTAMDAAKTACGDTFKLRMGGERGDHAFGGKKSGHDFGEKMKMKFPGMLGEKLGMTEDELKAALESGKTIEDIATEKGVDLPMPLERGQRMMKFYEEIDQ